MLKRIIVVVLIMAVAVMAAVRNPVSANKVGKSITIEAGKSITFPVYIGDPCGAYPANQLKIAIYSKSLVGSVVISPTADSAGPHLDPNCPDCTADAQTKWSQADVTISPSDLDVGTQTIWFVGEDQQADPNVALRNQDYKKVIVNVNKRIDVTPPCLVF